MQLPKARHLSSARFCLAMTLAGLLLSVSPCAANTGKDFQDIVSSVLRENNDLSERKSALRQSEVAAIGDRLSEDFSPSLNSSVYRGESPYAQRAGESVGADSKTISLELRQPIYRSGDERASQQAIESQLRADAAQLRLLEQDTLLPVITAYINAWRDEERLRLLKTAGDMAAVEKERLQADQSKALLANITGQHVATLPEPVAPSALPASLRDALARAESRHPLIVKAQHECAAAEASTRRLRWELEPDIDFNGSLGRTFDSFDESVSNDSGLFGVTATIPLRSADERKARTTQARDDEKKRRAHIDEQTKTVRRNVINAWDAVLAADKKKTLAQKKVALAQAAVDGRAPAESVLARASQSDRLRLAQKAALESLEAQAQSLLAGYRLLAATGQLGNVFSNEPQPVESPVVASAIDLQNYGIAEIEPNAGESDTKDNTGWQLNR